MPAKLPSSCLPSTLLIKAKFEKLTAGHSVQPALTNGQNSARAICTASAYPAPRYPAKAREKTMVLNAQPMVWSSANLARVFRIESLDSRIWCVVSSRSSSFSSLVAAAARAVSEGTRYWDGKVDSRKDCLGLGVRLQVFCLKRREGGLPEEVRGTIHSVEKDKLKDGSPIDCVR